MIVIPIPRQPRILPISIKIVISGIFLLSVHAPDMLFFYILLWSKLFFSIRTL